MHIVEKMETNNLRKFEKILSIKKKLPTFAVPCQNLEVFKIRKKSEISLINDQFYEYKKPKNSNKLNKNVVLHKSYIFTNSWSFKSKNETNSHV